MFATIGGWIAEGGIALVIGICLIGVGLCLIGIYRITDPNDGYAPVRRRPDDDDMQEWHIDPVRATYEPKHNGEQTRRFFPMRRSNAGEPLELNHTGSSPRVREAQEEDEQEEGRSYRERWEDKNRTLEDGEEGGSHKEATRTLVGWCYNMPMDSFWLLDTTGEIVCSVSAQEWEFERGRVSKDLFVQGLPMIPDQVPYHGREVGT